MSLSSGPLPLQRPFEPRLGIKQLTTDFGEQSPHFLKSLMYYYGVVTHNNDTSIRIPNQLVKEQFFDKLAKITSGYIADMQSFVDGEAGALQRALRKFSAQHFSVLYDEATEPSLKTRLVALLLGTVKSKYKIQSEFYVQKKKDATDEPPRVDIYLEPHNPSTDPIILEVKSIPVFWLSPGQFGKKYSLTSLTAKKDVAMMLSEKLSNPATNQSYFRGLILDEKAWIKKVKEKGENLHTVGDYIDAGKQQTARYLEFVKTNSTRPRAFIVWGVGMEAIHVEEVMSNEESVDV